MKEQDYFERVVNQATAFLRGALLDLKYQEEMTYSWNLIKLLIINKKVILVHRKMINLYTLMTLHEISKKD